MHGACLIYSCLQALSAGGPKNILKIKKAKLKKN